MDLKRLADPFPEDDIEWRISRAGMGSRGIYCHCLAYITARAIHARLDDVCGPENWRNEPPQVVEIRAGRKTFVAGISIRVEGEWVTKWDVAEATDIEPSKGGFSAATKRAGAQWGIGRYLYYLEETSAEVSDQSGKGWRFASLPDKHGGGKFFWRPPHLPAWALPKEKEAEITAAELTALKKIWREKLAGESRNPAELREGFRRYVVSVVGDFPLADHACWTRDALDRCTSRLRTAQVEASGIASDIPFAR